MLYYLLNRDFDIVTGIEKFISMIWTDRYYDTGDFELYIPADGYSMDLYTTAAKEHYYIVRADEYTSEKYTRMRAMIVEKVQLDQSYKDQSRLIIFGRDLKSILGRRVIVGTTDIGGPIEEELRTVITNNAISPSMPERKIPQLVLGEPKGFDEVVNSRLKGGYLNDAISSLCEHFGIGWEIVLNLRDKKFEFNMYKGIDRSYAQKETDLSKVNPYVVFSPDFDNISNVTYQLDMSSYKNVAYVSAEYKEIDDVSKSEFTKEYSEHVPSRKVSYAPVELDRYELFVDAADLSVSDDDTMRFHLNELREAMVTKGQNELDKNMYTTEASGSIDENVTFKINVDYFLGDIVSVRNEWGTEIESRVTEVIESWESSAGYKCYPTFEVENFNGKIEEENDDIPSSVCLATEDGENRITEDGELRRLMFGWIYTTRTTEDGEELCFEDGEPIECTDYEETYKYKGVDNV